MKLRWSDLAAVVVGVGSAVVCVGLTRAKRRSAVVRQQGTGQRQWNAKATKVNVLQARVAEPSSSETIWTHEGEFAAIPSDFWRKEELPEPEIIEALTAAATAFLGKKVRIRSAHLLHADEEECGRMGAARAGDCTEIT